MPPDVSRDIHALSTSAVVDRRTVLAVHTRPKFVPLLLGLVFLACWPACAQSVGNLPLVPTQCFGASPPSWCGAGGSDLGYYINQAAAYLATYNTPAGGAIQIPAGTWNITTEIGTTSSGSAVPMNDIEIFGAGTATLIAGASGFTKRVFHPQNATGLHIHDLGIANGTPNPTPAAYMDGIRCDVCTNVEFDHLQISPIQGEYGIATTDSNNVYIHDNTITNFGYGGIMNLLSTATSSSNIVIERNNVSSCSNTQGSPALCYGISIAGSTTTVPANTINGYVRDNIVSNILRWECYDTHGGTNQIFEGNTCANSYYGIMAGAVAGGSLTHVTIRSNHVERGTGNANGYGIALAGVGVAAPVVDGTIDDNFVDGYGASTASSTVGAIQLISTQNVAVTNNKCPTYNQACILLYGSNLGATITGNWSGNAVGAGSPGIAAEISFASPGSWGIYVDNNTESPSSAAYAPPALLYNRQEAAQVDIGPNNRFNGPSSTTIASASGVATATYVGGSTETGTAGQTCIVTFSPSGTGTLAFGSGGTFVPGTPITITAAGSATTAPTTATLSGTGCTASPNITVYSSLGMPTSLVTGSAYPMALPSSISGILAGTYFSYRAGTIGYDTNYRQAFIFTSPTAYPYATPSGSSVPSGGGGGFYSLDTTTSYVTGVLGTGAASNTISNFASVGTNAQSYPTIVPVFSSCSTTCSITGYTVMANSAPSYALAPYTLTFANTGSSVTTTAVPGAQTYNGSNQLTAVAAGTTGVGYSPNTTIILSAGWGYPYYMPVGMNINVGSASGAFPARIIADNGSTVTLDQSLGALTPNQLTGGTLTGITGSITGSAGNTCLVTIPKPSGSGTVAASGQVVLTSANTVASGTAFQMLTLGLGYTSTAPITVTLSGMSSPGMNNQATCSASATFTPIYGGVALTWQGGQINAAP